MNAVTIKATFKPSRQRKATRPPTLPTVPTDADDSTTAPSPAESATTRPASRVCRQLALACFIEREIEAGRLKDYAEAARVLGVSRTRMTQILGLLNLAPAIQEGLLLGRLKVSERDLRGVVREAAWGRQARLMLELK